MESSTGCIDAIEPHLPMICPFLIETLNDPKVGRIYVG